MSGENFETDEFGSESISSKYFTPSRFLKRIFSPNNFSMIHINLASLSKNIGEFRSLICNLNHPFNVIGITETRLYDHDPLINIEIDGFEFRYTPTGTKCGGAGIYIRSGYEFEVEPNITETIFVELKRPGLKNIVIGCIYMHHSPMLTFVNTFFLYTDHPLQGFKSHCSVRGYKLLLQQKLIDPPLECCEIVICWKAFIGEGVPNGCSLRKKA